MVEAFIICVIMGVFGLVATVYAVVMVVYEKLIKKSKKSILQIMNEI